MQVKILPPAPDMNGRNVQRLVKKIQAATETLFFLFDEDPGNSGIVQTKGRIRDLIWNLRNASGLGNDSPFLQDLKTILDEADEKKLSKIVSKLGQRKVKF